MKKIVFSDIDGTLAHYPQHFEGFGEIISKDEITKTAAYRDTKTGETRACNVLPSSTGMGDAFLSHKTIELVDTLRKKGMMFALISGMRTSTYFMRKPFLPDHDIAMVENGGIIFDGDFRGNRNEVDREWFKRFQDVTGPIGDIFENTRDKEIVAVSEITPPEERDGLLWDLYRRLKNNGWDVDAKGYFTCIRVHLETSKKKLEFENNNLLADIEAIRAGLPKKFTSTTNLGKIDFYPSASGKGNAVRYILEKKGIKKEESIALFDDNNDLPMAKEVGLAMLPWVSHASVHEAIKAHPEWIVSKNKGILGIEELLIQIVKNSIIDKITQ